MIDVQIRIAALLNRRRDRLPLLHKEVERWQQIDEQLGALADSVNALRTHRRTPSEMGVRLAEFKSEELRKGIAAAIELLRVLEARYARRTINIGVSGRARVGKSTLLQALSGLTDAQIPTGSGLPVTAVRSRIFHSATHQRATLSLHTFVTFRDEVLRPYHSELGLPSPASTLPEFKSWKYPSSEAELEEAYRDKHSAVAILRRLKDMQAALWSYEGDLTGGERSVALDELRPYVAYPTDDQVESGNCERRYLAVRDVRIECAFPHGEADHIGIVDLPGLGELAAHAEEHHIAGLQNEVDLVLLVKRPVEGMAYWGREDAAATDLLDSARGFIRNRRDFAYVVLNSGGADPKLASALRNDVRRGVNDGIDGQHFKVVECNALDQLSVYESVLAPALIHLAERLPVMDEEVYVGTVNAYKTLTERVHIALQDLEATLSTLNKSAGSSTEDLEFRTVELRKDLASSLAELVNQRQAYARSGEEDPKFLEAIENCYGGIQGWIETAFGIGKDAWCANALRQMRVDRNSSPFAAHELNRIRVEISGRYSLLDNYFHERVTELWDDTSRVLARHLGGLLGPIRGIQALTAVALHLSEASEPCPTLSRAVLDLLELRLEYRTHLHPRVRRELDGLNLQVLDPETGEQLDQVVVEISEAGAEQLFRALSQLAEQAAYRTKNALLHEALTPSLVLHAAAEQFEDALIRSGESEREFRRFARSFRDEIWPSAFQGIDEANATLTKVTRAIQAVRGHLGFQRQRQT